MNRKSFLLLVMLLLLTGCVSAISKGRSNDDALIMQFEQTQLSQIDMDLNYTIENNTNQQCTYGKMFTIEKLEDETWINIPYNEKIAFIMIAYLIEPTYIDKHTINLSHYVDSLPVGLYRMSKQVLCDKEITVYAEFEIIS